MAQILAVDGCRTRVRGADNDPFSPGLLLSAGCAVQCGRRLAQTTPIVLLYFRWLDLCEKAMESRSML